MLLASPEARAGLEGDEIVVSERFPTVDDVRNPQLTVVEAGPADAVVTPGQNATTIDVDSEVITLTFGCGFAACNRIFGSADFTGLALSDLDWSMPPGPPVRLEVEGSLYFDPARVELRPREILVNLLFSVWRDQDWVRIRPIFAPAVTIDVAPRSTRAAVPAGRISVAILGSPALDVRDVDLASLRFGPGGAGVVSADAKTQVVRFEVDDVSGDGRADLLVSFDAAAAAIPPDAEAVCLSGLVAAEPFTACDALDSRALQR